MQLDLLGLPVEVQHQRVLGGPISACGQCGKPVNLTEAHTAVVKGKLEEPISPQEDELLWFDVLTVLCTSCSGLSRELTREVARGAAGSSTQRNRSGITN